MASPSPSSPRPRVRRRRRPVIGPDGTRYESLTAAAVAIGIYPSCLQLKCQLRRKGWRYADDVEVPTTAPTSPDQAA